MIGTIYDSMLYIFLKIFHRTITQWKKKLTRGEEQALVPIWNQLILTSFFSRENFLKNWFCTFNS